MKNSLLLLAALLPAVSAAAPAFADDAYSIAPVPPPDTRNNFIPPSGAVYVVNQKAGTVMLCFPDTKDNVYVVSCTAATKLAP
jgi:hypothetical protein